MRVGDSEKICESRGRVVMNSNKMDDFDEININENKVVSESQSEEHMHFDSEFDDELSKKSSIEIEDTTKNLDAINFNINSRLNEFNKLSERSEKTGALQETSSAYTKKKIRKPFWIPLVACLLVIAIACCLYTYNYIVTDAQTENNKKVTIEEHERELFVIERYESTTEIATRLKEEGYITDINTFKIISKIEGFDGAYKKGSHYLKKGLEPRDIMKILAGNTETTKVTFPEHYTVLKIAADLEKAGFCKAEDFLKEVNTIYKTEGFITRYDFLDKVDLSKKDYALEGFLFPDTYFFDLSATPQEIIYLMMDNFQARYLPSYGNKERELGLSVNEVIILASIVERECKLSSEKRKVAGVFFNRLMKTQDDSLKYLQSCATLQYFIEREDGKVKEVLTREDERRENPYNTYLNKGLPPGPICNPGISSITAVLNLEKHDYFFFVLDERTTLGSHLFGKTQKEHENNISIARSKN